MSSDSSSTASWDEKSRNKCVKKCRCPKKCDPVEVTFQRKFAVVATPEQETTGVCGSPTPDSDTTATLTLKFEKGLRAVCYRLCIENGKKITQAHLHFGRAGNNGPIVAFLLNISPLTGPGKNIDGCAVKGVLTNEDIDCAQTDVVNIAQLLDAIRRGDIYLNVHSVAHINGVVRAQIFAE